MYLNPKQTKSKRAARASLLLQHTAPARTRADVLHEAASIRREIGLHEQALRSRHLELIRMPE